MFQLLLKLADRIRRIWWKIAKPQSLGVKVLVRTPQDEILLVKPVYSSTWQIPGGGVHRFEHPADAGVRELREETDLEIPTSDLTLREVFISKSEGKSDCVIYYEAIANNLQPKADGREILEAALFPVSALPHNVAPSVRRRLSNSESSGQW